MQYATIESDGICRVQYLKHSKMGEGWYNTLICAVTGMYAKGKQRRKTARVLLNSHHPKKVEIKPSDKVLLPSNRDELLIRTFFPH